MEKNSIKFTDNLIKGRIAEMIFEQMLRDTGKFTILAFGYENILPELASRQHDLCAEETMEIIRRSPDFAVINNATHDVHLIEVKYMMHLTEDKVYNAAKRMYETWKPSYLFIANPNGFYYGKVSKIVEEKGLISPLKDNNISDDLQGKYIELLNKYILANT